MLEQQQTKSVIALMGAKERERFGSFFPVRFENIRSGFWAEQRAQGYHLFIQVMAVDTVGTLKVRVNLGSEEGRMWGIPLKITQECEGARRRSAELKSDRFGEVETDGFVQGLIEITLQPGWDSVPLPAGWGPSLMVVNAPARKPQP